MKFEQFTLIEINYVGTDLEFKFITTDGSKTYKCDKCISSKSTFFPIPHLKFTNQYWLGINNNESLQNNLLGTISHLLPNVDKNFILQCDSIEKSINLHNDDSSEEVFNSLLPINSKYFDIEEINSLKIDTPSSFSFFHSNIVRLG